MITNGKPRSEPGIPPELAGLGRMVEFAAGERLAAIGQPVHRLLVLVEGLAVLATVSETGRRRILRLYRTGDMMGLGTLMESSIHGHEVIAVSPVRTLVIPRGELLRACARRPEVILTIARETSRQILAANESLLKATTTDVPKRLSRLLLDLSDGNGGDPQAFVRLKFPLTHEQMSQCIGASRPHTTTALGHLERMGAVRRNGRALGVRRERLAELAREERLNGVHTARRAIA